MYEVNVEKDKEDEEKERKKMKKRRSRNMEYIQERETEMGTMKTKKLRYTNARGRTENQRILIHSF